MRASKKETQKGTDADIHEEGLGPELDKWAQQQRDDLIKAGDAWREYRSEISKGAEAAASIDAQTQLARIHASEAAGAITKLRAAQETAAAHAAEYKAKLKALNDELDRLKKEASDAGTVDPVTGQSTDPKNAAQQQQLQNQIAQLKGQMQAGAVADTSNIQQLIAQPWLNAFQTINSEWLKVQNQMFYSTRNISLQFARMGQSILISTTDALEKMLLKHLATEAATVAAHKVANLEKMIDDAQTAAGQEAIANSSLMKRIALEIIGLFHHQATNTAKTTSDAVSAAAGTAATIPANIAAAESYAAVAGVAAAASVAAIPVVGWAMAPGVGASMYALGQGFAAMAALDTGTGFVPKDGVAMLHQGEIVVPAPTADELRGGGGSGDFSLTQNNHFHGFDPDREFQRKLDRNAAHVARAVQKHLRQGGRG